MTRAELQLQDGNGLASDLCSAEGAVGVHVLEVVHTRLTGLGVPTGHNDDWAPQVEFGNKTHITLILFWGPWSLLHRLSRCRHRLLPPLSPCCSRGVWSRLSDIPACTDWARSWLAGRGGEGERDTRAGTPNRLTDRSGSGRRGGWGRGWGRGCWRSGV